MNMNTISKTWRGLGLLLALIFSCYSSAQAEDKLLADNAKHLFDTFNYVVGTQTIEPAYKFTSESSLVETAQAIVDMGSNTLKISLEPGKYGLSVSNYNYSHELFIKDASYKKVLRDMDFQYYLFWVYAPKVPDFMDGMTQQELDDEYENMYKLAEYLLQTCNGTGKSFYLGHWEGDWHLLNGYDVSLITADATRKESMTAWYNIRQQAVDDAKSANPGSDVSVYHYCEVNRVKEAMDGKERIANTILPNINVDYVSYSCYDALDGTLSAKLNYIESKLTAKPGITGKRVFIGEYGFPIIYKNIATNTAAQQNNKSQAFIKSALQWGCPFILYWEMYNNEVVSGVQNGFWLIDNNNVKQPIYDTHKNFYTAMKRWVSNFKTTNGRVPTQAEYLTQAASLF
ncbi:hypothetical protein AGMMS50239_39860 [Bacteroidia bacterium]|nr:hypothetical protein AGMMS50239_39860 [Bacteroidia bacterium]